MEVGKIIAAIIQSNIQAAVKERLVDAFQTSFKTGKTIESCLGFRKRGHRDPATRELLERRNTLLQKLASEYDGSTWVKACLVADEIALYPRGKHKELFVYMKSEGMPLPESPQRVYQILRAV